MFQLLHCKNKIFIVLTSLVFLLCAVNMSQAATLSLSPASVKVSTGNVVAVKVLVNTVGQSINTAAGSIQFPTDLLQVMSVSKSSSIFSLWVQEPSFSNSAGTISFTGGVPNPGFNGQAGEIMSIVFKAKKQGNASVLFGDSSVLLNDGLGTNVLSNTKSTAISIISSVETDVPVINTTANSLPVKPIITSSTNPEQDKWYNSSTATFSWNVPSDVSSIQTILSESQKAVPTVTYDSSVSQRTVNNITDGVFYFHLRYINNIGAGPVATYKVQIDSIPPEKFATNVISQDVSNVVTLHATDTTSGIDWYSIQIDSDPIIKVQKDSLVDGQFILPVRSAGNHTLEVIAYDKAGNHTESYATYVSPVVVSPTIAVYPVQAGDITDTNCQLANVSCIAEIQRNENILVKGSTKYPLTDINVFVQSGNKDKKVYTTKTLADGSYSFQTEPLSEAGQVNVWSQLVFSNKVNGPESERVTLSIKDSLIIQTSKSIIYGMPYVVSAIILILGLLFLLYYGWYKFFGLKRKFQNEAQSVANDTHKAISMFKDELNNQLNKLEKIKLDRELNKKEEKIFKELQNNIDAIEEFLEKKLKKML